MLRKYGLGIGVALIFLALALVMFKPQLTGMALFEYVDPGTMEQFYPPEDLPETDQMENLNEPDYTGLSKYVITAGFKIESDYNISDYDLLKKDVDIIYTVCGDYDDVKLCYEDLVNKRITPDPGFNSEGRLTYHLEQMQGAERTFFDIFSAYQNCVETRDNDCMCDYKINDGPEYPEDTELDIFITSDSINGMTYFEMTHLGEVYKAKLESKTLSENIKEKLTGIAPPFKDNFVTPPTSAQYNTQPNRIKFHLEFMRFRQRNTFLPSQSYIEDLDGFLPRTKVSFEDKPEFHLYKRASSPVFNKLYFINDFEFTQDVTGYGGITKCDHIDRHLKIDAESNQEFLLKDLDGVKKRKINYRFAVFVPDSKPPEPVSNSVFETPDSKENTIVLRWEKNDEKDIDKYFIYYEKGAITDIDQLTPKEVDKRIANEDTFEQINYKDKYMPYEFVKTRVPMDVSDAYLENGKSYFITDGEKYMHVLYGVEDGETYEVAVVAVDVFGNKDLDTMTTIITVPEDNIPPGPVTGLRRVGNNIEWESPYWNLDRNNASEDIKLYRVYASEVDSGLQDVDLGMTHTDFDIHEANCNVQLKCYVELIDVTLDPAKTKRLGVTAVDDDENEYQKDVFFEQVI